MRYEIAPGPSNALDAPLDLQDITDEIVSGKTLARYCAERAIRFGEVRKWIRADALREKRYQDALELRKEWIVQTLINAVMEMASYDPKDIFLADGKIKPVADWPTQCRMAMTALDIDAMGGVKARFESRLKAIELMGKTVAAFAETVNIQGTKTLADYIDDVTTQRKDGKNGDLRKANEGVSGSGEIAGASANGDVAQGDANVG
jgi:hypothetical protein